MCTITYLACAIEFRACGRNVKHIKTCCDCVLFADIRDTVKYKDVMKEYPLLLLV